MKILKLADTNEFTPGAMKRFFLVQDSPYFKIINFNLEAGVTFPATHMIWTATFPYRCSKEKEDFLVMMVLRSKPEKVIFSSPRSGNRTVYVLKPT